jgi:hypothetical protein
VYKIAQLRKREGIQLRTSYQAEKNHHELREPFDQRTAMIM